MLMTSLITEREKNVEAQKFVIYFEEFLINAKKEIISDRNLVRYTISIS